MKKIECPSCESGIIYPLIPPHSGEQTGMPLRCPDCNGSGKVLVETEWKQKGIELKNMRLDAEKTLRNFCMEFGLDPVQVSKMERGLSRSQTDIEFAYQLCLLQNLCWEIEKLDPSQQQTKVSQMANDLYKKLNAFFKQKNHSDYDKP